MILKYEQGSKHSCDTLLGYFEKMEQNKKKLEKFKIAYSYLIENEINNNNFEIYKKNYKKVFNLYQVLGENFLQSNIDRVSNENSFEEIISLFREELNNAIRIKNILYQIHPDYKGKNILDMMNNRNLNETVLEQLILRYETKTGNKIEKSVLNESTL